MKNISIAIIFSLCIFISGCKVKQTSQKASFVLEGEITGAENNRLVYLKDETRAVIDSARVQGEKFRFTGAVAYPTLYSLTLVDEKVPNPNLHPIIPVFIENSLITVKANVSELSKEAQFRSGQYDYSKIEVSGSIANEDYNKFLKGYKPLFDQRRIAFRKYLDLLNYGDPSNNVHQGIDLVNQVDEAAMARNNHIMQYIKEQPASHLTLYLAGEYADFFDQNEIDSLLSYVDPNLLKTEQGLKVKQKIEKLRKSAVGAHYSDLSFQTVDGTPVRLSDYVAKGKYVLLEFWASWCVPCRADIPHIKENYARYHPEGFEIISISMDSKKEDWLRAVKEEKMPWLQVSDLQAFKGEVSQKYNFSGIPTCVLIDPEGKIVSRNMRGSWMDKILIEIYGDKYN